MKFNLLLLAAYSAAPSHPGASAFRHPHPSPAIFLRRDLSSWAPHHHRRRTATTRLHYKEQPTAGSDFSESSNGSGGGGGGESNGANVWSILANTERWISDTLDRSNQAEVTRQKQQQQQNKKDSKLHFADEKAEEEEQQQQQGGGKNNPYARKEVSYVCETAADLAAVVGGVFRRVREARELGESHGRGVEARLGTMTTDGSQSTTMRQTNVVVIPNCDELSTFQTFDALVQAINQARRAARDFVLKKKDGDDGSKEWV